MKIKVFFSILLMIISLLNAKIIIADVGDIRKLLFDKPVKRKLWETDITLINDRMQYGYETFEKLQYSIICKITDDKILPGKISRGRATYIENKVEKKCDSWRFVEGRLVHVLDFKNKRCRKPLGKDGVNKYFNAVAHVKSGFVVGSVDSSFKKPMEYSIRGQIKSERVNYYLILLL